MLDQILKVVKGNSKSLIILVAVSALGIYLAKNNIFEGMKVMGPVVNEAGGQCNCCNCGKIPCSKCRRDFKKCCAGAGTSVTLDI